jgi:hypothetical protein
MKNVFFASTAVVALAMPGVLAAQEQLTKEQLIGIAIENGACGKAGTVVDAYYKDGSSTVVVAECGTVADLQDTQELAGGMRSGSGALVGALVLVAVAAGASGGSTPSTAGTN